jgi:uncharacterized protein (DUF1330 family)
MSAYVIVDVEIKDRLAFEDYVRNVPPLVRKHHGQYLAVSDTAHVIEGNWKPHRLVLVHFPDLMTARMFLDDPEYLPWKQLRQRIANSSMVAIEGLS